jgi:UDP-N-acetylmuramoylalanine--D-glutamate ligase
MRPTISWADLPGRRVGVWGMGVEAGATLRMLATLGIEPVLFDDADGEFAGRPVLAAGNLDGLRSCEVVIKAPGISPYRADVQTVKAAEVDVVGGMGLWLASIDRTRVVCITGTKGKSTTTAIATHLLKGLGHHARAGGNIGVPPWDPDLSATEYWIVEVSSYQATGVTVSPPVTAVTSLHEDHLPWHDNDVERYYADKLSICHQPGAARTIANGDSELLRARADQLAPVVEWVHATDNPDAQWIAELGLLGLHNRRNALIAQRCIAALGLDASNDALAPAAKDFSPLANRLTVVHEYGGVQFVDDSLSTNVLSTLAAVDAFPGRTIALIVGGQDRGIDYAPLASLPPSTQVIITESEAADRIATVFPAAPRLPSLEAAVAAAYEAAAGDGVVLYSPAAPSFDRHSNYRERAAAFAAAARHVRDA